MRTERVISQRKPWMNPPAARFQSLPCASVPQKYIPGTLVLSYSCVICGYLRCDCKRGRTDLAYSEVLCRQPMARTTRSYGRASVSPVRLRHSMIGPMVSFVRSVRDTSKAFPGIRSRCSRVRPPSSRTSSSVCETPGGNGDSSTRMPVDCFNASSASACCRSSSL